MANVSSSNGLEKRPKLRFPGFDEPWKATAFGDLVHEFSNRTKVEDEDVLLSAAIEGMFLNTELFGHQRGASNKGYKKIKYGTMVLSTQNLHLGNANVNQRFEHGMVSPAYKTYDISGCSIDLIAQWIKSDAAKRFFYNATTVGASVCRRNVEWDTLYGQSLFLPSLPEQEKIANLLTLLSNRIEKQQQLIIALKKYKRGVVAAILSHQLKFSDATGSPYPEWTSCTLQDAVDFLDGQRKPLESADRAKRQGQYPYYGASGIIDYIDDFIFDEPLLLLGEDGANILNRSTPLCFIAEGKYWVNNHAHVMRPKAGQNIKFLCELLESLDYTRYNTGTAQPKLNQEKCRRIELALPVYEEQCRIANFLSALDQRADKAQSVLDYLLSNRAGLLQQLFI